MCVSAERAMSLWLIDEYEKGRLSGVSWSFSYQPKIPDLLPAVKRVSFLLYRRGTPRVLIWENYLQVILSLKIVELTVTTLVV